MKTEEKVYEIDLKESTQLNGTRGKLEELKRAVNKDYDIIEMDDDERPCLIYGDEVDMQSYPYGRRAIGSIRKIKKKKQKTIMGVAFATSPAALAGRVAGFVISQKSEGKLVDINEFPNGVQFIGVSKDPMKSMNGGEYTETLTVYTDGTYEYGSSADFAFCPFVGTYGRCDGPMHSDHEIGVTL